ncbi:hypothetical protein [Nodularia sphaerocarpa]|uniref:hypothetical protein n=1 Tax=Nodularia sphaerocarpa TaxID=137816 RepID=UPI001EFBF211|nr:hypothetical protein [Nodularia sphaerocarpa]
MLITRYTGDRYSNTTHLIPIPIPVVVHSIDIDGSDRKGIIKPKLSQINRILRVFLL